MEICKTLGRINVRWCNVSVKSYLHHLFEVNVAVCVHRTGQGSDLAVPSTGNEQKHRAYLRLKLVCFGIYKKITN